jgi:hypothetical protein
LTLTAACAAIEAHPEFWCDDPDSKAELARRMKQVRRVKKIAKIDGVLGLDTFQPY